MQTFLNPLNTSWSIWAITLLCAFLTGLSKSGLKGISMVSIPLLATVYGGKASVGILLPILIFGDLMALVFYHRSGQIKHIIKLFPWAVIGIGTAVITGNLINDKQFRYTIAISILVCIVILVYNEIKGKSKQLTNNPAFSAGMGITGGFATMIGNAAGPIFNLYLLSMRLPKNNFIGTGAWFFLTLNLFKVPFHIFSWQSISWQTFQLDLVMIPAIVTGAFIGRYAVKFIPEKGYRYFVFTIISISAIVLFFK
ncbi:sulfite exporter TauE/SafE family protein [Marinilabiliaceae bacterium JC017]|nr:sulfite exporter TauE/SafE family protein [Marinilabiliaceae bacterium JC017]